MGSSRSTAGSTKSGPARWGVKAAPFPFGRADLVQQQQLVGLREEGEADVPPGHRQDLVQPGVGVEEQQPGKSEAQLELLPLGPVGHVGVEGFADPVGRPLRKLRLGHVPGSPHRVRDPPGVKGTDHTSPGDEGRTVAGPGQPGRTVFLSPTAPGASRFSRPGSSARAPHGNSGYTPARSRDP
ncbi:hypothetical protein DAERI_020315 [Deinococcus aerius]|uniref:Uncharacterized protein n=1 Tax=Deinococcus aerius TaxID=200253 RepID=A0A2I9DFA0_9DEIO|nr:hypothetical protein DAERI_020315 [Deinococcus aerius]GMA17761.1 hypothetical protein GCM10025871_40920 [Deinococcus metallilatus]